LQPFFDQSRETCPLPRSEGFCIHQQGIINVESGLHSTTIQISVYIGNPIDSSVSIHRCADRELIEELPRFARGDSYDELAMPELDSEAIDFRAASELFAPARKLKRADLETLRLVTKHEGRKEVRDPFLRN
jgi:hypothetical protein